MPMRKAAAASAPDYPCLASPWSRRNFVDHTLTNQASIMVFIEDNWLKGKRLGQGSFDAHSNSITGMFYFQGKPQLDKMMLDESTGLVSRRLISREC